MAPEATGPHGAPAIFSASDNEALSAHASFLVTVRDTTPPTVTAASVTVEQTSPTGAVAMFTSTATDLVDGPLTPTCTSASGSIFRRGTTTVTCSATDAHGNTGTATAMVTVQDTIAPMVTYTGNAGSYTVDQTIAITCVATDSGSGVASSTCTNITGPASSFTAGLHTYAASSTDMVGNVGRGSTSFTIVVTAGSLQSVVNSFSTNTDVTSGLNAKLAAASSAANANARAGQMHAFQNQVNAQIGKALTAAHAAILLGLAQSLF